MNILVLVELTKAVNGFTIDAYTVKSAFGNADFCNDFRRRALLWFSYAISMIIN